MILKYSFSCLRGPSKLQIKARSIAEVDELAKAKSIPALVTHASTGRMQPPEIRADMVARIPALATLFDKWGKAGSPNLSTFLLTAVGLAIGHSCQRQVVGVAAPLDGYLL
jgi:hypothetical protein